MANDDLHIRVHHKHHWVWVPANGKVRDEDEIIQPLPEFPEVILVKRLVPGDGVTEVIIPADAVKRMADDRAWIHGAEETTQRHLHDAVARHLEDSLRLDHSPLEHWHKIEASDDRVQKALHARFIEEV